jgi:ABC-type transport system involved in multi-copper enzyme maturation permease subunit
MAITNLEVYRRFSGGLRRRPLRFWPITVASIRVASKRKIPLLLLYAVPLIATVIFSFIVYGKFAAEEELLPEGMGGGVGLAEMFAKHALRTLEVRNEIALYNTYSQYFALLTAAWFGSSLIAVDLKAGAHQLYFSRPLLRRDYFLGKFLTSAFFTACATLLPGLTICTVAVFSSPDWSFLLDEGEVIVQTILYSLVWIVVTSSVALCVSSLATRRSFALVGFFAVFFVPHAMGRVLGAWEGNTYFAISPLYDLQQAAIEIFQLDVNWPGIPAAVTWSVLGGIVAVSLAIVALRLRRLEVVG